MKRWLKCKFSSLAEIACLRGRVDLLGLYYKQNGILQYQNTTVSGEDFFISKVLKSSVPNRSAVLFDVGANVGEYSEKLAKSINQPRIFVFEPNPASFKRLLQRFALDASVTLINVGLGADPSELQLYDYSASGGSSHASLYVDVMRSIHHCGAPSPIKVRIETLESVCRVNKIEHIHFLTRYHHSRLKQRTLVTNVELGGRHQRSRNTTMLRNIFFSAQAGRRAPAIGRA